MRAASIGDRGWIRLKFEEKLEEVVSRVSGELLVPDPMEVASKLSQLLFPTDEELWRALQNPPSGGVGDIIKGIWEEVGLTQELLTGMEYPPRRERRRRRVTTRIHYRFSKDCPYSLFHWEERKGAERIIAVRETKKVEEGGIGPPPSLLRIVGVEKGDTFSKEKWDRYWEEEGGDYTKLPTWIGAFRIVEGIVSELEAEKKTLLEVGCGAYSSLLEALRELGISANVVGTDFSHIACSKGEAHYPEAEFLLCFHPYTIPWRGETFDYIFCTLTLHNFHRQAKGGTLLTLDLGLKEGGKLIVVEPSSKREDVEEIHQLLKSMGYRTELRRMGVELHGKTSEGLEARKRIRFYVLMAEKTESRAFPIEKWMAKSYLKDGRIWEAVEIAGRNGLNLTNLYEEMRREDKINVLKPPPPPERPSREGIRKEAYDEVLKSYEREYLELLENLLEGLSKVLEGRELEIAYDLFRRVLARGELRGEDIEHVLSFYNVSRKRTREIISSIYWKLFDAGLPTIREGKYKWSEVIKLVPIYSWPIIPPERLKHLEREVDMLVEEKYEKELQRYRKEVEGWRRTHLLHVYGF